MIKLIIFDLDGVLIDSRGVHFRSLNKALSFFDDGYVISLDEHLSRFDGLRTLDKLSILTRERGLPVGLHDDILRLKQTFSLDEVLSYGKNESLIELFRFLRGEGYLISCCSNSSRKFVLSSLCRLGLVEFFDLILSSEDVDRVKPYPEVYWKAMGLLGVLPECTLIVEDSPLGLLAAGRSGAHVLRVGSPSELTFEKLFFELNRFVNNSFVFRWRDDRMNILIPMAGSGSRFVSAGYSLPKPLIDVFGSPMIKVVLDSVSIDANYIFVVQRSHRVEYNLDGLLGLMVPGCKIVEVDGVTEGAACTTLLAREFIDNDEPLMLVNSDQFVDWDSTEFMYRMIEQGLDGGIVTFTATHPKWSFVRLDDNGFVVEVAEKNPISNIATAGFYYWSRGSDYVRCAERMIDRNIRVNNEFYVCPVYNEGIAEGLKFKTFEARRMCGLGTPEDLELFLSGGVVG